MNTSLPCHALRRRGLAALAAFLLAAFLAGHPAPTPAAGIVAGAAGATSVTAGADGREVVGIAPPVAGVSHNRYHQFNVGRAGADLDNRGRGARLIVNEVTGSAPSLIEGRLAVLGPRASVLIANPNGITVNGARFVNTGNLALSTGAVTLLDFPSGPGEMQRNVALDTRQGSIVVGPEGLSGAMIGLELIAAAVRIGGPVVNENTGEGGRLRIVSGSSRAEIDSAVSPTDNLTPWIAYAGAGSGSGSGTGPGPETGAVAIDITPLGSLQAGRIELIATDQGAGVRHAGRAHASSGAFTLLAGGELRIEEGSIAAAGAVAVELGGAALLKGAALTAGGGIGLAAASFRQDGASLVQASGPLHMAVAGSLVNEGMLIGSRAGADGPGADAVAVSLQAGGDFLSTSASPAAPAVIHGRDGDVRVVAGGELRNRHARIVAGGRLDMRAGGDVISEVVRNSPAADDEPALRTDYESRARRWLVLQKRTAGVDIDYGSLAMPEQPSYLVAQEGMSVRGANIRLSGGEVSVGGGALTLEAGSRILLQAAFSGRAHYERSCLVFCSSEASSTVQAHGGLVSAAGDIRMAAGDEILNAGGRVLTLGDLALDAPRVLARGVAGYTVLERRRGLRSWFGDDWAQIYASDVGGSFTALGQARVRGALVIDGGSAFGAHGVEASDGTVLLRPPRRDPVTLSNHLGLTNWLWQ